MLIKDDWGKPIIKYSYDPWGNVTSEKLDMGGRDDGTDLKTINPFRYRGYYYDEEGGLCYLTTRYYDPWQGSARRSVAALARTAARCAPARLPVEAAKKKKRQAKCLSFLFGSPMGNRTPVSAVRGRRLNRLTMRPFVKSSIIIAYSRAVGKSFSAKNKKFLKIFEAEGVSPFGSAARRGRGGVPGAPLGGGEEQPPRAFGKKRSACAAERKSVNPLLAGGCAAVPHQTFRS